MYETSGVCWLRNLRTFAASVAVWPSVASDISPFTFLATIKVPAAKIATASSVVCYFVRSATACIFPVHFCPWETAKALTGCFISRLRVLGGSVRVFEYGRNVRESCAMDFSKTLLRLHARGRPSPFSQKV